jgi:hypothetical protein
LAEIVKLVRSVLTVPFAEIVVEEIKVARTSSSVRPREASLAGSTCTRIEGF